MEEPSGKKERNLDFSELQGNKFGSRNERNDDKNFSKKSTYYQRNSNYHAKSENPNSNYGNYHGNSRFNARSQGNSRNRASEEIFRNTNSRNNVAIGKVRSSMPELKVADDIREFCKELVSTQMRETIVLNNIDLWQKAFNNTVVQAKCSRVLLETYITLPDREDLTPSPDKVLSSLYHLLDQALQVDDLRFFLRCTEKLKRISSTSKIVDRESVLLQINNLNTIFKAKAPLIMQRSEDFTATTEYIVLINKFFSEYSVLINKLQTKAMSKFENTSNPRNDNISNWAVNPTVEWLQEADWLKFPHLELCYESVEEYTKAMRGIWTALSFYWGAAALSPRCYYKDERGNSILPCFSPILSAPYNRRFCTMKIKSQGNTNVEMCGKPAQWCCYRRNHDALCSTCMLKKRVNILNTTSGKGASTDIYDANIYNLGTFNDSTVLYLDSTISRNPPEAHINWSTSYRLQVTSLVAIIQLDVAKSPIYPHYRLFWGEIHKTSNEDREESQHRTNGKLAIRLLTKNDCDQLSFGAEFTVGNSIAIIDVRVFVPEVISVLSTLSSNSFEVSLQRMPFVPLLLGQGYGDQYSSPTTGSMDNIMGSNMKKSIHSAIMQSEIRCVKHFSKETKLELINDIADIYSLRTMDDTQLEAFCNALQKSVHCTQGPPGTGKSYTGVALVLALEVIRDCVIKSGGSAGPIIVLSYKNHALDEFLTDVIRNIHLNPGELIRLGKPENSQLFRFSERASAEEFAAKKALEHTLHVIKSCTKHIHECVSPINEITPLLINNIAMYLRLCYSIYKFVSDKQNLIDTTGACTIDNLSSIASFELLTKFHSGSELPSALLVMTKILLEAEYLDTDELQVLLEWVSGNNLPLICQQTFDETRCKNVCVGDRNFCAEHACVSINCYNQSLLGVKYCAEHLCSSDTCCDEKLLPSNFCERHSCVYCPNQVSNRGIYTCQQHTCTFKGCRSAQLFPLNVCIRHKCSMCDCAVDSIYTINQDYNQMFCTSHKCDQDECVDGKVITVSRKEFSKYCRHHTCFKCIANNGTLQEETYPPRYTCQYHQLCEAFSQDGEPCMELAIEGELYCAQHFNTDDAICAGITKKGNPCKTRKNRDERCISFPWYCKDHSNQKTVNSKGNTIPNSSKVANCSDHAAQLVELLPTTIQVYRCNRINCAASTMLPNHVPWSCSLHEAVDYNIKMNIRNMDINERNIGNNDNINAVECLKSQSRPVKKGKSKRTPINKGQKLHSVGDDAYDLVEDFDGIIDRVVVDADEQEFQTDFYPSEFSTRETVSSAQASADDKEASVSNEVIKKEIDTADDNERAQERAELYRSDSDSDDNECYFTSTDSDLYTDNLDLEEIINESSTEWSFSMTPQQRFLAIERFLHRFAAILKQLLKQSDDYVDTVRKARAEASSTALKKAKIIGGTVVGAAKRLTSLRAAEPFAIVVEEACEVMEPTLIAVLAVESLQKLELIGDHRQLPAFISNNWFHFEVTVPKLKKSLFERLIDCYGNNDKEALDSNVRMQADFQTYKEEEHKIEIVKTVETTDFDDVFFLNVDPEKDHRLVNIDSSSICSVLDVQRRMRPYISDITREHYADVVKIIDDKRTKTQKIGDRINTRNIPEGQLQKFRTVWAGAGSNVPGVESNLYFWNLQENLESIPKSGISACNETEAFAVTQLVKYLKFCGVPDSSITIITPYQGQKRVLVQTLRAHDCLPKYEENRSNTAANSAQQVIVSTVDRYQGDENDIVILSLVRNRPGNRFVSMLNRFIVATSRARIGFFVVGSLQAISYKHSGGTTSNRNDLVHWEGFIDKLTSNTDFPQIGNTFPIHCSQHIQHKRDILSNNIANMCFPTNSTEWATFCRETCKHKLRCGHQCLLSCHVYDPTAHNKECKEIFPRNCSRHSDPVYCHERCVDWKCTIIDSYQRHNCPHQFELECYKYNRLIARKFKMSSCQEPVSELVLPCGHQIENLTCKLKRMYIANTPKCTVEVIKERDCGHCVTVYCCDSNQELHPCTEDVLFSRPRCKHLLSMLCHQSNMVNQVWQESVECATSLEPTYNEFTNSLELEEGEMNYPKCERSLAGLETLPPCTALTTIVRTCGHRLIYDCEVAFDMVKMNKFPLCTEEISVPCLFCLGEVKLPCHLKSQYDKLPSVHRDMFVSPNNTTLSEELLLSHRNNIIDHLRLLNQGKSLCANKVKIERFCQKEHLAEITCVELLKRLLMDKPLPNCTLLISQERDCGHMMKRPCHKRLEPMTSICTVKVNQVFVFPRCQHSMKITSCHDLQQLKKESNPKCKVVMNCQLYRCGHTLKAHCWNINNCTNCPEGEENLATLSLTDNVVSRKHIYCGPCTQDNVQCNEPVAYLLPCDHTIRNVPCSQAFEWANNVLIKEPDCVERVVMTSPLCGHETSIACCNTEMVNNWQPWPNESKPAAEEVTVMDTKLQVFMYPLETQPVIPSGLMKNIQPCQEMVMVHFTLCRHIAKVPCCDVFQFNTITCQESVVEPCRNPICGAENKYHCGTFSSLTLEEKLMSCTNPVTKTCSTCNLNKLIAPCNERVVHCHKKVTITLDYCGHEISWMCKDSTNDPRHFYDHQRRINTKCRICAVTAWERIRGLDVEEEHLRLVLNRKLQEIFNDQHFQSTNIRAEQRFPIEMTMYEKARNENINKIINRLVKSLSRHDDEDVLWPHYNVIDVESMVDHYYQMMFVSVPTTNKGKFDINKFKYNHLKRVDTNYGSGVLLNALLPSSLEEMLTSESAHVQFCVLLAFTGNPLTDVPPFKNTTASSAGKNQATAQANKTMEKYKTEGYDCVEICNDEKHKSFIFWHQNAVVPLSIVEVEVHNSCVVCGDTKPRHGQYGALCSHGHFICWDCFKRYLDSAKSCDTISTYIDENGHLTCADCKVPYDITNISTDAPKEITKSLIDLQCQIVAQQDTKKALHEQAMAHQQEIERIQAMDEEAREVHYFCKIISEEILTLKCPNPTCRRAFVDFDGCFAVTCSGQGGCNIKFCAWCFTSSTSDIHSHVAHCPDGNGSVYGKQEEFEEFWMKKRTDKVRELLATKPEPLQKRVLEELKQTLNELQLQL